MSSSRTEEHKMAEEIIKNSRDLDAPIKDVVHKIRRLHSAGLSVDEIEAIIPKLVDDSGKTDLGKVREPNPGEILVYKLPKNLENLYFNPE